MSTFKEKLSSGKFFATVCVVITYCVVIVGCVIMAVIGLMGVDVFLGIFSGFSALAAAIINGYFNKDQVSK